MTKIGLCFLILLLLACEKPNPNPELGDAIYSDLNAQSETAAKNAEAEKKKLEGLKKDLESAKPYTGDLKVAQKRYFESERKVQQYEQEKYYYSLRARSRKQAVRDAYFKNFPNQKTWEPVDETKAYEDYQKLSKTPLAWDANRRIANYTKETGFGATKKAGAGEKPKEEKSEAPEKKEE